MNFFYWVRRLYSLDTLDTRFTTSSTTPPRAEVAHAQPATGSSPPVGGKDGESAAKQGGSRPGPLSAGAQPSKWRTPEFFVYYVAFLICVPQMFKAVYDVSKESDPNYSKFAELLSRGWILGRKVDNSDAQYAGFRDNIPYMFLVLILHPSLRRVYNSFFPLRDQKSTSRSQGVKANGHAAPVSASATVDARLGQRASFDFYFATLFLVALHGFSVLKVLSILYINFNLATRLPKTYIPTATWIFNIGIMFANELCKGYQFAAIAEFFLPPSAFSEAGSAYAISWGKWLDSYSGLLPRWEILFNITVLRLVSFNLDYYWSLDYRSASPIELILNNLYKKKQLDPSSLSERDRVSTPASASSFTPRNYLAYTLYSPLYLTGPILTFNDYISQCRYPLPSITPIRTTLYALRFLLTLLCMELILHYIYAVAISKSHPTWSTYTPFQLSMLGFFNLHIIWLKLLLPWRFFRLWALLDGIDPPENMVRCMSDNYSALAFWRGWHRSFNRWIVRYIYVPLGGSGGVSKPRAIVNFLAVFMFVALWHDINLRLLMWGWLITLFVAPEVIATLLFPKRKWQGRPTAYRVICGVGAVGNILMMMAANLVGFAIGLDGLKGLVEGIVGSYSGLVFLGTACAALFVGVQVMFEIREGEIREGVRMKC